MPVGNPLINAQLTPAKWKTADTPQLLRGIYVELRVMNLILANALGNETYLDQLRQDVTSVFPGATDQD